jgi:hypothetical protein
MLVAFSIGNYRSFKDKVTFTMVSADIVANNTKLNENNIIQTKKTSTCSKAQLYMELMLAVKAI